MTLPIDWTDDRKVRALFNWLTRIGAGPYFGNRPISWYQIHQCHAYDLIKEACERAIPEQTSWRVRTVQGLVGRVVEAFDPARKHWIIITRTDDVYRRADERSRKVS